jgi:hypothetical protein
MWFAPFGFGNRLPKFDAVFVLANCERRGGVEQQNCRNRM